MLKNKYPYPKAALYSMFSGFNNYTSWFFPSFLQTFVSTMCQVHKYPWGDSNFWENMDMPLVVLVGVLSLVTVSILDSQ